MPNYTWNRIEAKPEVIKKLLNKDGEFTFHTFAPVPPELENTTSGGKVNDLVGLYLIENFTLAKYREYANMMYIHTYGLNRNATKKEIKEYFENRLGDERVDKVTKGLGGEVIATKTGKDYFDNFMKYRCFDWYTYHNGMWGTKWDAWDVSVDETCISFTTAWSAPEPILVKICKMFPNEEIYFEAEYEDNLLIQASNHHGIYVEDKTFEKEYPDDIDWDTYDEEDIPWKETTTGELLYA